jgi:hypothetical protein
MNEQSSTLTLHEYPLGFWIAAGILAAGGVFLYLSTSEQQVMAAIMASIGLILLLAPTTLTVTADRLSQVLTLRYRGLLRKSKKAIPIQEIEAIRVDVSQSSGGSDSSGPSYRIVVVQRDGQVIPFRSYYSSGASGKRRKAEKLRAFLGVGGQDETPFSLFNQGSQRLQQELQAQQEALTGDQNEEHVTDGVHWKLQTITFGGSAVTRWFSPDFRCPSGFLFLTQKVAGQKTMAGGLMGGVGKLLYQQSIKLYGFGSEDTPGLETADLLAPLDPKLEPHFSAFTSDPVMARQILNPWASTPLEDWATRYPLKQVQTQGIFGQLAVMFSPQGVYVASLGTMIPEAVEELTNLGVELVKAQGGR